MIRRQRISTYDRLGEINVLHAFLEAKLYMAIEEWDHISQMYCEEGGDVILGRLKYARNQVSVLKQLLRDSANPERTLRRWLEKTQPQVQDTTPTGSAQSVPNSGEPCSS